MRIPFRALALSLLSSLLSACGGGGGGGESPDTTAPTLTASPAPGGADLGTLATVTLTFSEPMDRGSVALSGSMATIANRTWNAGDTALALTPIALWPPNADLALTVNGRDRAGNALTAVTLAYHTVPPPDTTAPTATFTPATGSSIDVGDPIVIDFSEAVDPATLDLGGPLHAADDGGTWSNGDTRLTLEPAPAWPAGAAQTLVIDVDDLAGNALGSQSVSYDVTNTPPQVLGIAPSTVVPAGRVLGKDEAVVIRFNKSMDPATLATGGMLATQGSDPAWSATAKPNDTLTYVPKTRWPSGTQRVASFNVKDLAGTSLGTQTLRFAVPLDLQNFQPAEVAVGQPDLTSSMSGVISNLRSAALSGNPAVDGITLYLPDRAGNRVVGYFGIPAASGALANIALGQTSMTAGDAAVTPTQRGLWTPSSTWSSNGRLAVVDSNNSRVLLHIPAPSSMNAPATIAVGQAGFGTRDARCAQNGLNQPGSVTITPDPPFNSGVVYVADTGNNRVMFWDFVPNAHGLNAKYALGQDAFTRCAANDDDQNGTPSAFPTARTLSAPDGVWSDGQKLAVVDRLNNRVLLWHDAPTASFTPADVVLGQRSFTRNAPNDVDGNGTSDGAAATTLNAPSIGVWSDGNQLFVTDTGNARVLVWNSWPTANAQPADRVLGQGSFTRSTPNDDDQNGTSDSLTARTLWSPTGVVAKENQLFVTDSLNNRVLVFRSQ